MNYKDLSKAVFELKDLIELLKVSLETKPRITENYIRLDAPNTKYSEHKDHPLRTITLSRKDGIKALYCIQCKKIIVFLFSKDKEWTMAKARKWVKENS